MKVSNPPLIGNFFLPSLGLAVFSLAIGYWISRKKSKNDSIQPNSNTVETHSDSLKPVGALEKKKKKKETHKCGCGGKDTSRFEKLPSQIKILYGTLMGKSQVLLSFITNTLNQ